MPQTDPFALGEEPHLRIASKNVEERSLQLSVRAKDRLAKILTNQPENKFLRIHVRSGGCSGYQVSFVIDSHILEEDVCINEDGARVVISSAMLSIVKNATLDYQENFSGSFFHLVVPGSLSQCGCGESFAL